MEQKYEDITLFSKLGFLVYADGYTAKIGGMKPGKDQNGNDVWDFLLDPSEELIKRYKLKPNPNGTMTYISQIPYELVIQLNPDPAWTRWLYLRTYDGETTPAIQKLTGNTQQGLIMNLKKENRILMQKLEVSEENLNLMQLNMPKYLERNFKPMMEQMLPMFEKMVKKQDSP